MGRHNAARLYPYGLDYYDTGLFWVHALYSLNRGVGMREQAIRCGYYRVVVTDRNGYPRRDAEISNYRRRLGLIPQGRRDDRRSAGPKRVVPYDAAVRLCDGLSIDYQDVGV